MGSLCHCAGRAGRSLAGTGGTARGDVSCRGKARARLQLLAPPQVPSALLTFSWDAAVLEDIRAAGAELDSSILKPELLAAIEKLS